MIEKVIDKMRENPGSISDSHIAAAISRIRAMTNESDEPRETEIALEAHHVQYKAVSELKGGEYPKRHIKGLESMRGPGLKKAQELVPRVKSDAMFLLASERGCGKTQIATYLAYQRRLKHGKPVGKYVKALDLFEALKETWNSRLSEDSVLRPYRQCGLLVIDEIHERGESEWENRKLVNLIDHRYDRMLVTILLGNVSASNATEKISPSIISRMNETGGIVNCDWPSYR